MISAVIITKNEEKNIKNCFESVKWADEIVVVDDFSTDKTADISRKYTQHIYKNKFINYSQQKKIAFLKATGDWIFSLDADEVVTDKLKNEILKIVSSISADMGGYYIPRKNFFLGKWMAHCGWYPDYQLRFFRNDSWGMKDAYVHESVEVVGNKKIGYLKEPFLHYSYSTINEYVERMNKYASLAANQMFEDRIKINASRIKKIIVGKAFNAFWKMYVKQYGFKDGMHGLILSVFSGVYRAMVYTKYWELSGKGARREV